MTDNETDAPPQDAPVPQSTDDMLRELLAGRAEDRAELAALRAQIDKAKAPPPRQTSSALSVEELQTQRAAEIAAHDYYCPGCGRLYDRERECTGRPEAPHAPLEVVSTDELKGDDPNHPFGDESLHTAAPGINP